MTQSRNVVKEFGNVFIDNKPVLTAANGLPVHLTNKTPAVSGSTGALMVDGGIGVIGGVWSLNAPRNDSVIRAALQPAEGSLEVNGDEFMDEVAAVFDLYDPSSLHCLSHDFIIDLMERSPFWRNSAEEDWPEKLRSLQTAIFNKFGLEDPESEDVDTAYREYSCRAFDSQRHEFAEVMLQPHLSWPFNKRANMFWSGQDARVYGKAFRRAVEAVLLSIEGYFSKLLTVLESAERG
ncbi:hypothetical protein BJ741DRAFT_667526 [Chytriomyces cf. hyalinus JEL632]|nr:hypothetical protein BJ741DRAFT_667526 [Chytriomyces cf. hyalinus JEL632]